MMALPTGLNDIAKLTLLASDASYFKTDQVGSWLAALSDTMYGSAPQYSVPQLYKAIDQWVDSTTGFGIIIYKKDGATPAQTEIILALRGTDGPNPQDWVANSQYLGWNQWQGNRDRVFNVIDSLRSDPSIPGTAFEGKIHFTGQSLGGGLAQYAAYEYVQSHQNLTGFSKANITLTTFNGFGGVLGLQQNLGTYSSSILADIGSNAHFYTEGDLVSRLGSLNGVGHTGGTTYMLNAHASQIDPDTGEPFLLNFADAHRIETGFYPFLLPGIEFEAVVARPIEYLPMQDVQRIAALYGRIANDQDVSPLESGPRLAAGLIAGLALGDPAETNGLVQAVLTNLHSSGQMSDDWYVTLRKYDWGAIAQDTALVLPGATGAAYGVSLLAAMLSDALEFQVDRHEQLFNNIRDWVSSAVPTVERGVSQEDRRLQGEMLLALVPGAAIGSKLAPLLQPLALDINEFAETLATSGTNWLHEALVLVRDKGNLAGQNIAMLSTQLTSAVAEVALGIGASPVILQEYLNATILPFVRDTAHGIANAVSGYLQDVAGAFDLGRALNFNDVNLIAQAYAAELSDPQLTSPIRTALEEAQAIVQRAGQTVVVQQGIGANPFTGAGFDPHGAPPATVHLNEGQLRAVSINLPYEAGPGGQRLQLTLSGPNASAFVIRTDGAELTGQNGTFTLIVPEGQRQLVIGIHAKHDVTASGSVTGTVTLLDALEQATHSPSVEATVSIANTGTLGDGSAPTIDFGSNGFPTETIMLPDFGSWAMTWVGNVNYVVQGGAQGTYWAETDAGNDQLYGGPGWDRFVAYAGKDRLEGFGGNDQLEGWEGDDVLLGGDGDDTLHGDIALAQAGEDHLDGGGGNDFLMGGSGDDVLIGGTGNDTLMGEGGATSIDYGPNPEFFPGFILDYSQGSGMDTLDGGEGNDTLVGFASDDILLGGDGADVLVGDFNDGIYSTSWSVSQDGADYLDGGNDNDRLYGGGLDDILLGGAGNDILFGEGGVYSAPAGNDWLDGGENNDQLFGGLGADALFGGAGDDLLIGDFENELGADDTLYGGAGADELQGGGGNDLLTGGTENDRLYGEDGEDSLLGDEGDDELHGGLGEDRLAGGNGGDQLFGQEGDDILDGEAGDDLVKGGLGNDYLDGGDGVDDIQGQDGGDVLIGGGGNDFLHGDVHDPTVFNSIGGNDFLYGEDGDDSLFGDAGDDQLFGGEGADQLIGDAGNDALFGGMGHDSLFGDTPFSISIAGNDVLDGEDGNDLLQGGGGNDRLNGGTGDDILIGELDGDPTTGAGDDILIGGVGNDRLVGGAGRDTYVFEIGYGIDTVEETVLDGNNVVSFGAGITSESIALGATHNSVLVRVGSSGDSLQIFGFAVNTFQFANGMVLTYDQLLARGFNLSGTAGNDFIAGTDVTDRITGGAGDDQLEGWGGADLLQGGDGADLLFGGMGDDLLQGGSGDDQLFGDERHDVLEGGTGNDVLVGGDGDDLLEGGIGDDQLLGGAGHDTYRFNIGDGIDNISDSMDAAELNRVVFGAGITASSLTLTTDVGQILVRPSAAFEGVKVGADGSDALGFHAVDLFQFEDGTSLTYTDLVARGFDLDGTEFDDWLFGTNVIDRFRGGIGNDRLEGGEGHDSYFLTLGDGVDTIVDATASGAGNEVVFGAGIASADLRLDLAPDRSHSDLSDLLIRVGTGGDAIQLDTFDRNNVFGAHTVETFRFADGSMLTYGQLLARGFDLTGTDGDDQISGTNVADRIVAGDGADVLRSGAGDDTLEGGLGNDQLVGGQGNDTYVFGPGAGHDTIQEFQGELDRIRMAAGVAPSDVVVTRNHHDLVLSLNGGADQLTVSLYFLAAPLQIELVQFADGMIWDQAVIDKLVHPTITGTAGPDLLVGTSSDDRLAGLAGNDQLTGLTGNDRLDGGIGADTLAGGAGNDTYIIDESGDLAIEDVNEGTDTVQSLIAYTLGNNLEHLILIGNVAVNGTGNDLDNVLAGNGAANVFHGGAGNDTYVIGAGDAVVELAGEGTDTVQTDVSLTLGANVENLTLTGSASLTGTGNELDNVLQAEGSISVLAGGAGNDLYLIGPGDDLDVIVEAPDGGIDTIRASRNVQLPDHIERLELVEPLLFVVSNSNPLGSLVLSRHQPVDQHGHPLGPNGLGNAISNTLIGTGGGNRLDGGLGADTLIGGQGDDTYVVDHADDVVVEGLGEGHDTIHSSVSTTVSTHVEDLFLLGTASITATGNARNNLLRGNDADNVLDGGAGADSLQGGGGADTYLFGRGSGQDSLDDFSAHGEIDTIQFALDVAPSEVEVYRRDDSLVLVISGTTDELTIQSFFDSPGFDQKQLRFVDGTVWNDSELRGRAVQVGVGTIVGTTGSDTLTGGVGYDTLIGGTGDDVLSGGFGSDTLYGDETAPTSSINGEPLVGNDILRGGPGTDFLFDYYGSNLFDGGAGDDLLFLGFEQDTVLFGRGSGSDHVYFDGNGSDVDIIQLAPDLSPSNVELTPEYLTSNRLTLRIRDTDDQLVLNLSMNDPTVRPADVQGRIQFADGTQWDLSLAPALDPTMGTAGHDVLNGAFTGSLRGLAGNDEYRLGSEGIAGGVSIIEAAGEGTDTVQSLLEYTLDANVENLILAEVDSPVLQNPRRGTGNERDNLIIGNTADNTLDGGPGNDVLVGGLFYVDVDNFLVGDNGSDVLIGGEGDDTLIPFAPSTRGAGFIDLRDGFNFGDSFRVGRSITDVLPNRPDDILLGGLGNDTYILFHVGEMVSELPGEGIDTVKSVVDYTLGDNLENLTLLDNLRGAFALQGIGNEFDNVLIGNLASNVLRGEGGDDTLWGGRGLTPADENIPDDLGNDLLAGSVGHDTYLFNVGDGIDTVEDTALAGEGNRIQFGIGISRSDLTFTHDQEARTLTIQVGSSGTDQLRLLNFDPTGTNGSLVACMLAFADGSVLNLTDLFPMNHAPTVAIPLADQTVSEDAPFSIQIPAATFADPDAGEVLTLSASLANGAALPTWLTFNPTTRTFSGTPDDAQVGSLDLRVTATDTGNLSVSDTFTLTVQNINEAPTVAVPIADQQATEDVPFSLVVPTSTFADVDPGETLACSATLDGGAALPTWLTFDPVTRILSGTPLNSDVSTLNVAVTATDLGGLSASDTFVLAIQNVNDAPTVANPIADQTVVEDAPFSIQVPANTFADQDANDTLTYHASLANGAALPLWLIFNATTRTFSGTPDDAQVGSLDLRVTATDTGTLSAADVFTLTVTNVNEAPTVAAPLADQQATQGAGFSFVVPATTFVDVDPGDSLTYSATLAGGAALPTWLSFNPATRAFTGTPQAGDVGAIDVRVTATDQGNLNTSDIFALTTAPSGGTVGNDTLIGTSGHDLLDGLAGDDVLRGLAGNDTLIGGSGNDLLDGGTGSDTMVGGLGSDTYVVSMGDTVVEQAAQGFDTVQSDVTWTLGANLEALTLTGTANINGTGNVLDNLLTGNSGANVLTGGAGNDVYVIGTGDMVVEGVGAGTDTVLSEVTTTLSANVELLGLTGTAAINGTGNSLANGITGNGAANVLDGGTGSDLLAGLGGDDTYIVDHIGDLVIELANNGVDQVQSAVTTTLAANVEHLTLTGDATINGTGNALDNVLKGNSATNLLSGANGHDTLRGGAGNDTVNGGSGNDTFLFGRGDGQDLVQDNSGTADKVIFDAGINPFDLVLSRQANDLRVLIHGSSDRINVQNWYLGTTNQIETIQAGNGQTLLNTQVNQLIQAMAGFTAQTGLTWDQAIDQRPQDVQTILAASWQ
jgi:Ca2+-binding RTX toxin-like protein